MSDARNEFISKAKNNLDKLDSKIIELEAKANEKGGEVRRELKDKLGDIMESRQQIAQRLEELQAASKPAWEDVKLGVEQAWNSLSDAVNRAGERFQ